MQIRSEVGALGLVVSPTSHSMTRWALQRPLSFAVVIEGHRRELSVPRGFITDFASVPRFFYPIIPPMGRYGVAAVVHDYLCTTNHVTRSQADWVFRDMMQQLGVKRWRIAIMYAAVRAWAYWQGTVGGRRHLLT